LLKIALAGRRRISSAIVGRQDDAARESDGNPEVGEGGAADARTPVS
jgi:hypothetical protein